MRRDATCPSFPPRLTRTAVPAAARIDDELAGFIQGAASIIMATRNAEHRPALVRAQGCRVDPDGGRLVVLVAAGQAAELLDDIRDNHRVAVVFTRPSTHRSVQVKGEDARVVAASAQDLALAAGYRDAMVAELALIGVPEARVRALLAAVGDMVAIEFSPSSAFVQTPGPDAGRALEMAP